MAGYGHNNSFAAQEGRKYTVTHDSMLMDYLHEICSGESRTAVKAYLTKGQIVVNDRLVTAYDHPLKKGDRLLILRYGKKLKKHSGEIDTRVKIVYEDDHIIVAEKRHAVLTMSTGKEGEATAYSILTDYVKRSAGRKGGRKSQEPRIFIVHRLDRNTSGLLMVAKNNKTHEYLAQQIKDRKITKKYRTIVNGNYEKDEDTINLPIGRNPKHPHKMAVVEGGKDSVTLVKVLERFKDYTYLELTLVTGRTHQIRVHMSHLHHPVFNDTLYGAKQEKTTTQEQVLQSYFLRFTKPFSDEIIELEIEPDEEFKKVLRYIKDRSLKI